MTTPKDHSASTSASVLRVGVIAGSTRPARRSPAIAAWVAATPARSDLHLDVIDLVDQRLPLLCEPKAAVFGEYEHELTRAWAATVAQFDAFVIVSPEYNASFPASLKNALDHLYAEWHDKPVALVGYGMDGGRLAIAGLRPVVAELRMLTVPTTLALSAAAVEDGRFHATAAEVADRAQMVAELATLGAATPRARIGIDGVAAAVARDAS